MSTNEPTFGELKQELLIVLDRHIDILKTVTSIEIDHLDGVLFMMRSLGFMLDRAPKVLASDDLTEMHFMMFQYYSLLSELKYNLVLNFPLLTIIETFPTSYETAMKQWWENRTGLVVEETKQTIEITAFQ